MPPTPPTGPVVGPERPTTRAAREARVTRLVLNPSGNVTFESGRLIVFAAIPLDQDGNAVEGVVARWISSNPLVVLTRASGEALTLRPGTTTLTASVGQRTGTLQVR